MDTVSALIAALVAGAVEAAKPTAAQLVKDSYAGLKGLITRRFGKAAVPMQAVEEKPESTARQAVLKEELEEAKVGQDGDVLKAMSQLVDALQQHAPGSISHVTNIQAGGSVIHGPVTLSGGSTLVGRDQVINNITLHAVDQIGQLTDVLRGSLVKLVAHPDSDALDLVGAVLDEITKLYQLIDSEMARYLSLTMDDLAHDRSALLSLDGGLIQARAAEARGHCGKIHKIYSQHLRPWFKSRLDPPQMDQVESAFGALSESDADMAYVIHQMSNWLSSKATATLDLVDKSDLPGARQLVKNARLDALPMRQKLARTVSEMRDLQAQLLMAAK
jgi:hypothetical protein